jgi:hypothetical protein
MYAASSASFALLSGCQTWSVERGHGRQVGFPTNPPAAIVEVLEAFPWRLELLAITWRSWLDCRIEIILSLDTRLAFRSG